MLRVERLSASYGRVPVLKEVDLEVRKGEIVTLLGANGAGKSTLLLTLAGVHPVGGGSIFFENVAVEGMKSHTRVELGIALSPEGRQVFKPLSVEDNLRLGAYRHRQGHHGRL